MLGQSKQRLAVPLALCSCSWTSIHEEGFPIKWDTLVVWSNTSLGSVTIYLTSLTVLQQSKQSIWQVVCITFTPWSSSPLIRRSRSRPTRLQRALHGMTTAHLWKDESDSPVRFVKPAKTVHAYPFAAWVSKSQLKVTQNDSPNQYAVECSLSSLIRTCIKCRLLPIVIINLMTERYILLWHTAHSWVGMRILGSHATRLRLSKASAFRAEQYTKYPLRNIQMYVASSKRTFCPFELFVLLNFLLARYDHKVALPNAEVQSKLPHNHDS